MRTSLKRQDYREYEWKRGEWLWTVAKSSLAVVLLAVFFYRSIWAIPPLAVVGVFFFRENRKRKITGRRERLVTEFRDCILSVTVSLKAGYAVENAFIESRGDMLRLHGENSLIFQELEVIRRGLVLSITLEELLQDLGERSMSEEIKQFAQIFSISKRSGGSQADVLRTFTELISRRLETKQEIAVLVSGRRMEQRIMQGMPFLILLYIEFLYPGYFDSLYHNWQGIIIMTGCLCVYILAYILGQKILEGIGR